MKLSEMKRLMLMAGADRDKDGAFLVYVKAPVTGLGGQEVVVSDKVEYSVNGDRFKLVDLLKKSAKGTGTQVQVF